MGKSPGKWMKTLLFGKKSSKSKFSKGKEKEENDKEVQVASKAMENNLVRDQKMSSGVNLEDNLESDNLQHEVSMPVTQNEDVSVAEPPVLNAQEDLQKEQAATKVQTALRGYLARRAFRSLKGVIRLQALARGHLVRRQAVSTLYCMMVIVKLQALARGRKIRRTDIGIEVQKKFSLPNTREANAAYLDGINTTIQLAKLSANGFVRKILASSPTPVPLRFQYDPQDMNSVFSWLERWSASRCWKRVPQPRKVSLLKSQKNCTSPSTVVSETNRVKPSMRKPPVAYVDSGLQPSETDKHRRNVRKVANHFVNPVVEDPQHELEKVKRSLRRVHNPALENTVHPDTENEKPKFSLPKGQSDIEKEKPKFSLPKGQSGIEKEKPKHALRKISNASDQDVSEHNSSDNTEKVRTQAGLKVTELSDIEKTPETLAVNEGIEREQDDHAAAKVETLGKNEHSDKVPVMNEGTHEDMSITNERKKSRRRASLPAKQESKENELQIRSSSLPSYMAATESAKAKLRGQGSPRLGQDGPEKSNLTRRYSLPLNHSKSASFSPRVQKPIQMIEKGAIKTDRSLQLSRDGNVKVNRTEWRR